MADIPLTVFPLFFNYFPNAKYVVECWYIPSVPHWYFPVIQFIYVEFFLLYVLEAFIWSRQKWNSPMNITVPSYELGVLCGYISLTAKLTIYLRFIHSKFSSPLVSNIRVWILLSISFSRHANRGHSATSPVLCILTFKRVATKQ